MNDRPVIALTSDVRVDRRVLHFVFSSYVEAIERAGGLPLHVPPIDPAGTAQILAIADGVLVVGGEDLDPALWGEEPHPSHQPVPESRQRFDLALAGALRETRHPVLGVCYGCQLLVVAAGGALCQDLPVPTGDGVRHGGGTFPDLPRHEVAITPGSRLAGIVGNGPIEVNSAHHQAPSRLAGGLLAAATAPDGVIEAVEAPGEPLRLGVMWHPELMPESPAHRRLFRALVDEAAAHRARRS